MKPSPFSDTYAHPGDPLPIHLERVARRAAASIAPTARAEARLIAYLAGLFHDIGKATPYFQEYLLRTKRKTALTPHAKSGAVLSWWYTGELGLPLWQRLAVFIAVLRHHGALKYDSWLQALEQVRCDLKDADGPLVRQISSMDLGGIHRWLCELAESKSGDWELPVSLEPLDPERIKSRLFDRREAGRSQLRRAFHDLDEALLFLAGFGGMLAVDKLDAATQGAEIIRQDIPSEAVAVYKASRFVQAPVSALDGLRTAIAQKVEQTWLVRLEDHLLTLTAPTGSGKTLTVLNAALGVRSRIQKTEGHTPRVIYCLPFTSVIDQNHEVFRAVLKANGLDGREDLLLKHHHLVDGLYRTADAEHLPDGAGQLFTETWQSEIVVTTFYQLLHTLLSKQNANLKRAGQLAGAIVLMDEVQAIPLRYWQGLRHLFQSAARCLGTRFVLLTATRPLIFRPADAVELLPDHDQHFCALSRVRLHCHQHTPITLDKFADRLIDSLAADARSALIILNRRSAVRALFARLHEAFPERRLIALSTDLTPRDRRARIRLTQRLQRQGQSCIVVSTQLIEAGVDVSFPVVHRDLAPLDSIVQSAGRCNRHATAGEPGEVHVWKLLSVKASGGAGGPLWGKVYDSPLIEVTEQVLGDRTYWDESDFLILSQRYFEGCWHREDQVPMDEWLTAGDFETLHNKFQLIEDGPPKLSLFIVSRPADAELWERYEAIRQDPTLSPLEKDMQFRKVRHAFFERVIQVYASPDPVDPIVRLDADNNTYTRETGYIPRIQEEAACIL